MKPLMAQVFQNIFLRRLDTIKENLNNEPTQSLLFANLILQNLNSDGWASPEYPAVFEKLGLNKKISTLEVTIVQFIKAAEESAKTKLKNEIHKQILMLGAVGHFLNALDCSYETDTALTAKKTQLLLDLGDSLRQNPELEKTLDLTHNGVNYAELLKNARPIKAETNHCGITVFGYVPNENRNAQASQQAGSPEFSAYMQIINELPPEKLHLYVLAFYHDLLKVDENSDEFEFLQDTEQNLFHHGHMEILRQLSNSYKEELLKLLKQGDHSDSDEFVEKPLDTQDKSFSGGF